MLKKEVKYRRNSFFLINIIIKPGIINMQYIYM